jgi:hypothetical protein
MVKNPGGGNNKKYGRKYMTSNKAASKLRVSENEDEVYAIATKMLGNCMFNAIGIDGLHYKVQIRGKFSGRNKRDNYVNSGSWVLLGGREFTSTTDKKKGNEEDNFIKSDLLEVYNEDDKRRLTNTVTANWNILHKNDVTRSHLVNTEMDDSNINIQFVSAQDVEDLELIELMKTKQIETVRIETNNTSEQNDWLVNADDI